MAFAQDVAPNTGHEFTLTRIFAAPRALVFRMWVEPEHLRIWSCPQGFTIPEASGGSAEAGQSFRVVMQGPDGVRHALRGTYLEVKPVERISFTHRWEEDGALSPETTVTVRLEETADGGTRLTMNQGFFANAAIRDGHEGGWSESLDKLGGHLETIS